MSRTRKSKASVILQYFQDEPIEVAQTMYDLVTQAMRERVPKPIKATKIAKRKPAENSTATSAAS